MKSFATRLLPGVRYKVSCKDDLNDAVKVAKNLAKDGVQLDLAPVFSPLSNKLLRRVGFLTIYTPQYLVQGLNTGASFRGAGQSHWT